MEQPQFVLTIPSDLTYLSIARAFLTAVCQARGLSSGTTDAIALAVHEALNNVIRHAHGHRAELPLELRCCPGPDALEIQILDQGEPFDIAAVPNLDPAELRLGGRGVFLMRALTDELSCRPRTGRGNVLRLVKRCAANCPPPARP